MFRKMHLSLAFAVVLLPIVVNAEQPLKVSEQALKDHVISRTEPFYPPIARAARITGTVVPELQVGTDGKIISAKVVSGPAMMQQAAIDCVKKWNLKPFEKDGIPVPATGQAAVVFSLGKDDPTAEEEKLAAAYFPASDECHANSRGDGDPAKAAQACKKAAEIAEQFPADRRFIEKRSAFVFAAWALMMNGDMDEARRYADLAVETVKLGHDDNSGQNAAYFVKGMVEGKSGRFEAADQDLGVAEDFERKAIDWGKGVQFEHLDSYTSALERTLQIHAQVLQAMGKQDEAQKKLEEAAKVK